MKRRVGLLAVGAAFGALMLAPVSSSAAVTIGSDLAPDPDSAVCGPFPCTVTNSALPDSQLTSPLDGVVVRWRIRGGNVNAVEPVLLRLNVLRPGAGGAYMSVGASDYHTFSDGALTTRSYPAGLRIAPGDQIGVDISGTEVAMNNFTAMAASTPGAQRIFWEPPLAPGESRAPEATGGGGEVLINADIEPDCDADGLGDESQDTDIVSCTPSVVDIPPDSAITGGPEGKTKKKSATFTYTGNDASGIAGFQCKLDDGAFESCGASKTYTGLKKGQHTFSVRAVDIAGNVDPTPATRTWKIKKKKKKKR